MKSYLILLAVLPLTACAITSGNARGPDGTPVHYIDGMSASVAYAKANKLCPGGYRILGEPRQTSVIDYVMTVECKSADDRSGVVTPDTPSPAGATGTRYRCTDLEGHPYVTDKPAKGCVVE